MVKIYCLDEDTFKVEGDINYEFEVYCESVYLSFSDGTLIKAKFDKQQLWFFDILFTGTLFDKKIEDGNTYSEYYSAILEFKEGIKWVTCGEDAAK